MQQTRMASLSPQQTLKDARFWDERNARANSRHLAAIRELIAVRELRGDAAGAEQVRDVTKHREAEGITELYPPPAGEVPPAS
jgi:hypothetical protein